MKNLINSEELDQIIEKLDNLLVEGHLKYTTQRRGYFQEKDKDGFNVETYRQETIKILDLAFRGHWYTEVI